MASLYIVPPDMKEKEKIVGGILTISQFGWLMLGLALAGFIFIILYELFAIYSLIVAVPTGLALGLPFAFYKKEELTLFQYLRLKSVFKKKPKQVPNRKKGDLL